MVRFPLSEVVAWEACRSGSTPLGEPTDNSIDEVREPTGASTDEFRPGSLTSARERFSFFDRLALLDFVGEVGGPKRIATCLTQRVSKAIAPALHYRPNGAETNLFLTGLRRCESWVCPVCSDGKARVLRSRIQKTVVEMRASSGKAVLMTLSMRHDEQDSLRCLLSKITKAWKRFSVAPVVRSLKKTNRLKMWAWVIELEHGPSGWHPHLHALATVADDDADVTCVLQAEWCDALSRVGGDATIEAGCLITSVRDNVADYLTKQWSKRAKSASRRTPLQLGGDAMVNPADEKSRRLYREFMDAMSADVSNLRSFWLNSNSTKDEFTLATDKMTPGAKGYKERVLTYDEVLQLSRYQKRVTVLKACLTT